MEAAEPTVEGESEEVGKVGGSEGLGEKGDKKGKIQIMAFFMGVWAMLRKGFEKLMAVTWFSWLPIWREAKKLDRLMAEADANPKDAAKQAELLAELNKHRFVSFHQSLRHK